MHLQMRTTRNEISEMVIAGNIIRRRAISVVRAIWFGCCKLLKICFFNSRIVKEYLQGFSLSINLAVCLQRFSIFLHFVLFEAIPPPFFRLASNAFPAREDKGDREGIPHTYPIP